MRNRITDIKRYLLIGFISSIPGVLIATIVSRTDSLAASITLFIALQFIVGLITTMIVKKSAKYDLQTMDNLMDISTHVEVIQGYIKWVKQNEEQFNEKELKQHYINAKKITDTLERLNESTRDTITK